MLWHHLAVIFGKRVPELQEEMSSSEFGMWCAYARLFPIDPLREEFRWSQLIAAVLSPYMDKSKARTMRPEKLSPYIAAHTEPLTDEEWAERGRQQKQAFKAMLRGLG